jgi:PAS domain S-box-containing protein
VIEEERLADSGCHLQSALDMNKRVATRILFFGVAFLAGAAFLMGLSFVQKMVTGIDPFRLTTYVVPVLVGGTTGLLLGYFFYTLKAANARLAAAEALQRTLLDTIDVGVFIMDDKTRVIEKVNHHVLDLMEVDEDYVVGKTAPLVICDQVPGGADDVVPAEGKAECILLTPGKAPIPVLRSVKCLSLGGEKKRLETVVSISRQKRAEFLLESEAQRRKALLEKSNDGIAIIDQGHRVVEANERFAAMLGYSSEEVVGLHSWEYDKVLSKDEILNNFKDLTKVNTVFETVHRRKDGSTYDVEVSARGLLAGGVPLILVICRDISDRKRFEAALVEAKQAAESSSKVKSEFLANMSHEIRTPINGIMGMLQLMNTTELTEEQHEFIEYALQASNRLIRLLSDILDLSRVESGRMEIVAEPFSPADVMESLLHLFAPVAREQGIELRVQVSPDIPASLNGDALRTQQILVNLVGNALKFSEAGRVDVDVRPLPVHAEGECRLLFTVSDTGPGIADEQMERVFTPFTQVDGSYRRRFQGAGLGLAICARLLELMNGTMAVDSQLGVGSQFYFSIPFALAESAAPVARKRLEPIISAGVKILLAEDDHTSRLFARRVLEKGGHTVTAVENGEQALEALQAEAFDILLVDIQMPVLDGMETVKALRQGDAGETNRDIPIIALTAHSMAGDKDRFLEAGMNWYVAKPLDVDTLLAAVVSVLE